MTRGMAAVLTTINEPTEATKALTYALDGKPLIVVGDRKTPSDWELDGATFLPWKEQRNAYAVSDYLPFDAYQRKNHGYLEAMKRGATPIFETDDDNGPVGHWSERAPFGPYYRVRGQRWTNIYAMYTERRIWPRGYPPQQILSTMLPQLEPNQRMGYSPIQQELVIGSPDVDAIWRLTVGEEPFEFEIPGGPYEPGPGTWCPFNSQATWWWPEAYPLMYLPVTVPWRACDIWRGLVAQRVLWERDRSVWFHFPTMRQDRNEHDLLVDLEQEIEVYTKVDKLARVLEDVHLVNYVSHRSNMVDCYRALVSADLIDEAELPALYAWLDDVKSVMDAWEEE